MAVGDEIRKSFASDAATYSIGLQTRLVGGNSGEALANWPVEKKPAAKPSAHRSIGSADTADVSGGGTSALDVGNSSQVAAFADFSVQPATCEIFLALYDESNDLIGVTDSYIFSADPVYRDGVSGPYVSKRYIFDVSGASKARAYCATLTGSTPTVNIFLIAL